MIYYTVYDNGKPAKYPDCKVHPSWDNCNFSTIEEARIYAQKWLGSYGTGLELIVNIPSDYSGEGDTIEIRELNTGKLMTNQMVRVSSASPYHGNAIGYFQFRGQAASHGCVVLATRINGGELFVVNEEYIIPVAV